VDPPSLGLLSQQDDAAEIMAEWDLHIESRPRT
jgi:hypothetical protein